MSVLRGNSTFIKSCPLGRQCFLPGWCPRSRSSRMSAGGLGHQCVSGSGSSRVLYFTVTCLSCSEHGNHSRRHERRCVEVPKGERREACTPFWSPSTSAGPIGVQRVCQWNSSCFMFFSGMCWYFSSTVNEMA